MALTDLGRVCPVLRGAYDPGTAYSKLDVVSYLGSSYICKTATTGNLPTSTTHWQLLAEAGDFAGTAEAMVGINLLHNYDFRTPVNQRGVSGVISTLGYFYDRWLLVSGTVTIGTNYLTVAGASVIEQRIEGNRLAGADITVSVMVGGTVHSATGTFPTSAGTVNAYFDTFGVAVLGYASGYMFIRLNPPAPQNIEMVKLELGAFTTLDRQPPVDYGAELLKCQRYYISLGTYAFWNGYCYSTTGGAGMIYLPVVMRSAPTFSATVLTLVANGANYFANVTGGTVAAVGNGVSFAFTGTSLPSGHGGPGTSGVAALSLSSDL